MINIQPGKGKRVRTSPTPAPRGGSGIGNKIAIVFKVAFFVAIAAGIINSYIYLNQKLVETDRKIASGNRAIHQIEREIERLRIHRETFRSWRHISKMMAFYGLDLRVPRSGQICKLTVLTVEQAAMVPFAYRSPQQQTAVHTAPAERVSAPRAVQVQPERRPAVRPVRRAVQPRRPAVRPTPRQNTARTRNGYPLFDAR